MMKFELMSLNNFNKSIEVVGFTQNLGKIIDYKSFLREHNLKLVTVNDVIFLYVKVMFT